MLFACGPDPDPGPPKSGIKSKTFASAYWSPTVCPSSGLNLKDVEISSDYFQARHLSYVTTYANWIHRPWRMLFNQNVKYVGLKFNKFMVEPYNDYLMLTHAYGSLSYSGYAGQSPAPPLNSLLGPWQVMGGYNTTGYLEFKFWSNAAMTNTGYRINKLNLLCHSSPSQQKLNNTWIIRNYPHDGYLQGTDDVIYVRTKQPAGYEMALLLYPLDSCVGAPPTCPGDSQVDDFDLYASAIHQLPVWNDEWTGRRTDGLGETVIIDPWPGPGERDIYIAIGSFKVAGQFRFYANLHPKVESLYTVQNQVAWTLFPPNGTEKSVIRDLLRNISRATYFATDGRHLIKKWYIGWNTFRWSLTPIHIFRKDYTGHSVCQGADTDRPCGDGEGEDILWNTGAWCNCSQPCACFKDFYQSEKQAGTTASHEMGHCIYGLDEEYEDTGNCGHSLMHKQDTYLTNITDFCHWRNGGKDPWPETAAGHSQQDNNWDCLKQRLTNYIEYPTDWTPDAFYRTAGTQGVLNENHDLLGNVVTFDEVPY